MSKLVTLNQLKNLAQRTKATIDEKTTETDIKDCICDIEEKTDGVEFVDGKGNVVYKIPAMA